MGRIRTAACSALSPSFGPCSSEVSQVSPRTQAVPLYTKAIPEEIVKAFGAKSTEGLNGTDPEFRKLVKFHCKLPAYFGVVMIQRIQECRKIAADLVFDGQLSSDCLDYIPGYCESTSSSRSIQQGTHKIGLRDFLRFWTPEVRNQNRLSKFLRIVIPPTREGILALEKDDPIPQGSSLAKGLNLRFFPQELHQEHLEPLVQALVDRHPDLVSLKHDGNQRRRYVRTVLTSLFFRCTGNNSSSMPLKRVIESNLSSLFFRCATCSLMKIPAFNLGFFDYVNEIFERCVVSEQKRYLQGKNEFRDNAAVAAESCVCIESLKLECIVNVCQPILFERLYLHSQRVNERNRDGDIQYPRALSFEDLIRFILAVEDRMMSFSVCYWFRLLDLDDDGYLNRHDLEGVYQLKLHKYEMREGGKPRHFHSIVSLVLDVLNCRLLDGAGEFQISSMDIRRSCGGSTMFDLFVHPGKMLL